MSAVSDDRHPLAIGIRQHAPRVPVLPATAQRAVPSWSLSPHLPLERFTLGRSDRMPPTANARGRPPPWAAVSALPAIMIATVYTRIRPRMSIAASEPSVRDRSTSLDGLPQRYDPPTAEHSVISRRDHRGTVTCWALTLMPTQPQACALTIRAAKRHADSMRSCVLTLISSAGPCPTSRGCSTRYSCTACPCRAARPPIGERARRTRSCHDRLHRAAMGEQGHDDHHRLGRRAQPIQASACGGAERCVTHVADASLVLRRMDTNIAPTYFASGRTVRIGAE